jgi:hypothetical protein
MAARDDTDILLTCIPVRGAGYETDDQQRVVVLQPRFRWRLLQALMVRWRRPYVRVHLDEIGSRLWLRCDGKTAVASIAESIEAELHERVAPAQQRTARFFRDLQKAGLVTLLRPSNLPPPPP